MADSIKKLLSDEGVLAFVKGVPGLALTGAKRVVAADGSVGLEALPAADPKSATRLVRRSVEPGATLGPALLIARTSQEGNR